MRHGGRGRHGAAVGPAPRHLQACAARAQDVGQRSGAVAGGRQNRDHLGCATNQPPALLRLSRGSLRRGPGSGRKALGRASKGTVAPRAAWVRSLGLPLTGQPLLPCAARRCAGDGTALAYSLESGDMLCLLEGHSAAVLDAVVTRKGR